MHRRFARAGAAVLLGSLAAAGCKRAHGDTTSLRDALAHGDAVSIASAVRDAPTCPADAGARAPEACLGEIAGWLGSKTGFHYDPPDQAGAATAALVVAREGRGEWVPAPDAWLFSVRTGTGEGADALRLAMALRIAENVTPLARALSSDDDARALMRAVARSVPGACDTYARLGAGEDVAAGAAEGTVDHSPCVQKDLERHTGPKEHGRYGSGLWRGAEGALALWKEATAALREGVPRADARMRGTLEAKVVTIGAALDRVATTKLPPAPDYSMFMSDVHGDAGAAVRGAR